MTSSRAGRVPYEFDAFGVAVGATVVSGGLAVVLPFLLALTGTLAALAFAAWVALARARAPNPRARSRSQWGIALFALGLGATVFLLGPEPLARIRGLLLALALLPLWAVERNPPPPAIGPLEAP
jgi:hypothetical protein